MGSANSAYAYSATSNRLSQITGSNPRSYTHDPVGSITADGVNTFVFDTRGRMAQSLGVLGTTDYKVNSLGQRIRKTGAQDDTIYHYDSQGRLIAESSAAGVTHGSCNPSLKVHRLFAASAYDNRYAGCT